MSLENQGVFQFLKEVALGLDFVLRGRSPEFYSTVEACARQSVAVGRESDVPNG